MMNRSIADDRFARFNRFTRIQVESRRLHLCRRPSLNHRLNRFVRL
jgi:hypothetical protein